MDVPFDVVGNVAARRMLERVLVEDAKALVDGLALLLNLGVDAGQLFVELVPVFKVAVCLPEALGVGTGQSLVHGPADFQVPSDLSLLQGVVFARTDVEHELVSARRIICEETDSGK